MLDAYRLGGARPWVAAALVVVALLLATFTRGAQAQAQTLKISFDGDLTSCSGDPSLDGPVSVTFTATPSTSGSDTIIEVAFGADAALSVAVPTADIEAIAQAVASAGGTIEVSLEPTSLGAPTNCVASGTLKISVSTSGGQISGDAPASSVLTFAQVQTFANRFFGKIQSQIKSTFGGKGSSFGADASGFNARGMAAGSGNRPPIGVWMGYSYTDTENDFVTTAFDSKRHDLLVGFDVMPADNWLLGVALGLERTESDTRFNQGEQKTTAMTVAPYVGVLLSDWLTVDGTVGVSTVSTDQFRTAGATRVTSDVEATRVFFNVNATATRAFGSVLLTGRTGMLYATQDDDSFRESNGALIPGNRSSLGRLLLGGEVAYSAGAWEPYVGGTFQHDYTRTSAVFAPGVARPKNDDSDVLFSAGIRYFGDNDLAGTLEYSTVLGRRNLDENTFSANVRWKF